MSQKSNRHQRRPSQGLFVFPDNLSDPLPKNDVVDVGDQTKGAIPGPGTGTASSIGQPVSLSVVDKNGVPLPTPAAKSSGEISSDDNLSSKSKASSHAASNE